MAMFNTSRSQKCLCFVVFATVVGALGAGAGEVQPTNATSIENPSGAPAQDGKPGECTPLFFDTTSPENAIDFSNNEWEAIGEPSVTHVSSGVKISRQEYELTDKAGNVYMVEISCMATCTGNGCGVSGCDPSGGNCSACNCTGTSCAGQCSCTKFSEQ
jgi:hypothetical protein